MARGGKPCQIHSRTSVLDKIRSWCFELASWNSTFARSDASHQCLFEQRCTKPFLFLAGLSVVLYMFWPAEEVARPAGILAPEEPYTSTFREIHGYRLAPLVETHAANIDMPADREIERQVKSIRPGNMVHLKGLLVETTT